jgi:chaperonin cofactor prefoldin
MPRRSTSYKEWLYETLRDKEEAANCLQAASEDSPVALAVARANVDRARHEALDRIGEEAERLGIYDKVYIPEQ